MNNTIKSREFASILVTLICVKMLFTYPRLIMEKCENGAWLSVLVWGLAAAGVYYLTQKMYLKTGCISILAQSEAIGGKPLKMLTGLAVMALLIANMAPLVRAFPEAIKTALLQKSSMAVIATLLTVGVVVGAYNGVCALGRVASIFLPVAAAFILGFFVILIPFYDVNNLFPAAVAKNLTAGSASLSVFSDIFAANLLLPYISGSRCVKSAGLYAVFISIISSAAILLAYCLTYPYPASTSFIVPMYQLARGEGLSEFGELIARSEEIRPNTYLSVTSCAAKEYLAAIKPTNEVNPVQYYQVIFDSDYTGFIPHNPSQDFYAKNMSAACENVLPLSGIKSDGEAGIFTDNFEYMTKNYFAGEVEADGDEQTQTYGMAVFSGGRMIAAAGAVECELYNILTGDYSHSAVTYLDRNSPDKPVSVDQSQRKKPKIKVDLTGDVPKIKVKVFLEGDLRTVAEDYIIEENQADFEKQAADALRSALLKLLEKTARTYRSDIVGFGNYAKRSFPDYDAFAAYDWQNRYPESKFEVEAEFILRRSGLINRRSSAEGGRGV